MSESSPARRWFQFDLRTLMLIVTIVAVWLAWRYAPPPKPESDMAKALKVGDRVTVQSKDGQFTVTVGDPGRFRGYSTQYTVEALTDEVVRLKGDRLTKTLRISEIVQVNRFDDPPASATAANPLGVGGPDMGEGEGGGFGDESALGQYNPSRNTNSFRNRGFGGSSFAPGSRQSAGQPSPIGSEEPVPGTTPSNPSRDRR